MRRVRKHVDRLDVVDAVLGRQGVEVAGEARWVARDVDDRFRTDAKDRVKQRPVAADAGRVDDDDVRLPAFVHPFGQPVFRFADDVVRVRKALFVRVFLGVFNRFGDRVHAAHFFRIAGEPQPDRADAAVGVNDPLRSGESGRFFTSSYSLTVWIGLSWKKARADSSNDKSPSVS